MELRFHLWGFFGSGNITSAGKDIARDVYIEAGSSITLLDDFSNSGWTFYLYSTGAFNANNYNVRTGCVTNNGSVTMGSGICTLDGQYFTAWDNYGSVTANTSTLKIITTSNYSIPFSGGGASYYNLWYTRGASTGDNSNIGATTFNDIKDDGSASHKFIFPASTTINVTSFTESGASCGSKNKS